MAERRGRQGGRRLDDPAGALARPGDPRPDRALGRTVPGPRGPDRPGRGHDEHARRVGPLGPRADRPQRRRPRVRRRRRRGLAARRRSDPRPAGRGQPAGGGRVPDARRSRPGDRRHPPRSDPRARRAGRPGDRPDLAGDAGVRPAGRRDHGQPRRQRGLEHAGDVGARRGDGSDRPLGRSADRRARRAAAAPVRPDRDRDELAARVRDVPRRPDGGRGARAARGDEPRVRGPRDRAREPRPFGLRGAAPGAGHHRRGARRDDRPDAGGAAHPGHRDADATPSRARSRPSSRIRWRPWPPGPTSRPS